MKALPNKHYNGHCRAAEEQGDQRTPGKEILRKNCGQQVSGTAGESSTKQSWMETSSVPLRILFMVCSIIWFMACCFPRSQTGDLAMG